MYGVPHIILTVESARFVYIYYITNYYETVQFKQSSTDCLLVFSLAFENYVTVTAIYCVF